MPTLIRLLIVLVLLGGLGYAGLWFLAELKPAQKTITITIPARELLAAPAEDTPLSLDNLPAPVNVAPRDESSEPSTPADGDSSVLEIAPGAPE
jgi:hypothetical protein